MDWFIAVGIVIALAGIAYYAVRLGIDMLVVAGMVVAGIIKVLTSPFRHRH